MNIEKAVNFDDLRTQAKRKLPRIAFDFIEGGADDEFCLARNRDAFRRFRLLPRYLVDVTTRDQSCTLLGRTYSSPFGISPTGLAGLFRPHADLMLAAEAAAANIPYLMSSASTDSIEEAAQIAPHNTWFQIYGTRNETINDDLVRRARDAALETLVLSIDIPVNSNRERNRRNGFTRPLKMTPAIVFEAMGHPVWVIRYLRSGGMPMMKNWANYAPPGARAGDVADLYGTLTPAPAMTWRSLDRIRSLWPGKLVVKGILHPQDAVMAMHAGVDGIIVSNHGGRQLDSAPSPVEMLPSIRAAVGERVELMLDSGVRRGSDIVTAICLGARAVTFGRPTLYGAAAGGRAGVKKAIDIMRREVDTVMAQIGCTSLSQLGVANLYRERPLEYPSDDALARLVRDTVPDLD
ncbi:alpha-hydroxy-acid oxidizing enzyme [Burkholderia sp. SG-MS1]|uniref:alpha-hydroxy acid oxidase n=1 Tax=Paraburkholderia sp. SG-MS1 TaxID=2023741 RepID=UPI001446C060|nr:alpha-hydroxy acid oxidase [Paraburkholderia sp. SG-MS1]NKJ48525.1 alpha-hydroxy-acid oxidizing enzyme [Paraburkholderia sp. SG-MS1]